MTDTAPTEEPVAPPALPPDIQAKLDAMRADIAAKDAAALQAAQAEQERIVRLDAAKQVCTDVCGPLADLRQQSSDPRERALLMELEAETHESHREVLENAYLESNGQRRGEGNQAQPGVITPLESHVSVLGDNSADVQPS